MNKKNISLTKKELENIENFLKSLDINLLNKEILEIETKLKSSQIWKDIEISTRLNKSLIQKKQKLDQIKFLENALEDYKIAVELEDFVSLELLEEKIITFKKELEKEKYFTGKFDDLGCHLQIYAGSGGLDAQDWVVMLLEMYKGYCKIKNWKNDIIDLSLGEEGGIKFVEIVIEGEIAYGYLKEEIGVHRLVRLSPFNNGNTRETSFALVNVIPTNLQKFFPIIKINEKDLKWDYFMSSGKGGQGVNTTYSAVRVTHIPTGIICTCQNQRNQLQNKNEALKNLQNKLLVLEVSKKKEFEKEITGNLLKPEWGNQIRNYVLHPYKLVKDARTGWETKNIEEFLSGKIEECIWSYKYQKNQ